MPETEQVEGLRIGRLSHIVFGVVLVGWGILGLYKGDFASGWLPVPASLPGRQILAYLCAMICIACGVGLFFRKMRPRAAFILLVWIAAWLLLLRLPWVILSFEIGTWWSASSTAIMLGSAWLLYVEVAAKSDRLRFPFLFKTGAVRLARVLFGFGLIPIGLAHFLYIGATAPLVPAWLLWPEFWGYFTGAAFITAGLAIAFGILARLAAVLVTLQIALMTLIVWVPLSITGSLTPFQWGEFAFSIVLTAFAWVFADSYQKPHTPA